MVEGKRVQFQVKVMGNPTPTLTWYHNGNMVSADNSMKLEKDGTLTLPSAESKHSGLYKLVAQNPAGEKEREVRLLVEEAHTQQEPATNKPAIKFNAIEVAYFGNHVERNHRENNRSFIDEYEVICYVYFTDNVVMVQFFQSLPKGDDRPVSIATTPSNKLKNRFANICVCKYKMTVISFVPRSTACTHNMTSVSKGMHNICLGSVWKNETNVV